MNNALQAHKGTAITDQINILLACFIICSLQDTVSAHTDELVLDLMAKVKDFSIPVNEESKLLRLQSP